MAKKLINHDFVKQLVEDGKSVAQISRKLDVSPGLMYRWFDHEGIDLLNQVRANGKKTQLNGRKNWVDYACMCKIDEFIGKFN